MIIVKVAATRPQLTDNTKDMKMLARRDIRERSSPIPVIIQYPTPAIREIQRMVSPHIVKKEYAGFLYPITIRQISTLIMIIK